MANLCGIPERVDLLTDDQRYKTVVVLFDVGLGIRSVAQVMGMSENHLRETRRRIEAGQGEYAKAANDLRYNSHTLLDTIRDYLLPNTELVRRINGLDPAATIHMRLSARRLLLKEYQDE